MMNLQAVSDLRKRDARWFSIRLIVPTVLLLLLVVPLVVMLFGACLPPGLLWPGEANGYDVLEYHLQGPREYYQAGRIMFLPHNVYTSFPQQMELLYLLLMYLTGRGSRGGDSGPIAARGVWNIGGRCAGMLVAGGDVTIRDGGFGGYCTVAGLSGGVSLRRKWDDIFCGGRRRNFGQSNPGRPGCRIGRWPWRWDCARDWREGVSIRHWC